MIWFSFDYNSHDMLNKLGKFSRNKLRSEIISMTYFYRELDKRIKLVSPSEEWTMEIPSSYT